MPRHRLRDAVWALLHAKLVAIPAIWKRDVERLRQFIEAVVHVLRTGVAWEDLPERLGKPNSLYRRFRRWSQQGIWDALFESGIPEDELETVMVDATITKAQRFASGARGSGEEDLGRSRGGLTTKIHVLVDPRGRPWCCLLTPGQAADCRHAQALLEGVAFVWLIGDRAYDTDAIRVWCAEHGIEVVIPSKRNSQGRTSDVPSRCSGVSARVLGVDDTSARAGAGAHSTSMVSKSADCRRLASPRVSSPWRAK